MPRSTRTPSRTLSSVYSTSTTTLSLQNKYMYYKHLSISSFIFGMLVKMNLAPANTFTLHSCRFHCIVERHTCPSTSIEKFSKLQMPKAINFDHLYKKTWGDLLQYLLGDVTERLCGKSLLTYWSPLALKRGRDFYGQIDIFYAFLKTEHFCTFGKLFTDCVQPDG